MAGLSLTPSAVSASSGDGTNAHGFKVLCGLVSIAKNDLTGLKPTVATDDDLRIIEQLNMSLSADDFYSRFPETTPQPKPNPETKGCGNAATQAACLKKLDADDGS
ncbi:Trypanosomal VSG domain containing protein [Trypanosoma brucei equiperdum]|uniref:Trypanosomal VSG domain containing protein n=1 Tax=Trypanosoma brucei equiperdum TaxID=630700 RepID=A0A3L6L5B0_9TRYP|nr:Trypanosomal VSG domain containing protein [Trypanosoma brucei equiperdum]